MRYAYAPESEAGEAEYRARRAPAPSFPAPEVTTHEGVEPEGGWPGPVVALVGELTAAGWDADRRYARGHGQHATSGRATSRIHTYSVRFRRENRQGYAVYRKAVDGSAATWSSVFLGRFMSITELREELA